MIKRSALTRAIQFEIVRLRRQIVLSLARKRNLKVSRKVLRDADWNLPVSEITEYVFSHAKRRRFRRSNAPPAANPRQGEPGARGNVYGNRGGADKSTETVRSAPDINNQPTRKRKVLLALVFVVVITSAAAVAYWWPVIVTRLFAMLQH